MISNIVLEADKHYCAYFFALETRLMNMRKEVAFHGVNTTTTNPREFIFRPHIVLPTKLRYFSQCELW